MARRDHCGAGIKGSCWLRALTSCADRWISRPPRLRSRCFWAPAPSFHRRTVTTRLALPAASIDIPATDPLRTTPSAAVPQVAAEFELPPGFAAVQWADALEEPIALAFSPDGRLFVAETGGRVWTFLDADGDGRAEEGILFAEVDAGLHSIAVASDRLVYLGGRGHVSVARDRDGDGRADTVAPLVRDLFVGQHASNRIALGPDGRVYITIVSPCDEPCAENNPLSVSILTLHPDSPQLESYASGLHDPHGLAFSPDGALWATDRGFDSPCVTSERLTRVAFGTADGRPDCAQEPGPQRASVSGASALDLGRDAGARGIAWFESDLVPPKFSGGFYIAFATAMARRRARTSGSLGCCPTAVSSCAISRRASPRPRMSRAARWRRCSSPIRCVGWSTALAHPWRGDSVRPLSDRAGWTPPAPPAR